LVGCHSQAIDDRANAQIGEVEYQSNQAMISPSCRGTPAPNCGLLATRFSSAAFHEHFRQTLCTAQSAEACDARFERMVNAWLRLRYFAADFERVSTSCDLHPGSCDDLAQYESELLESHNAHIEDQAANDEVAIQEERDAAQAAYAAATADTVLTVIAIAGDASRPHPSHGWHRRF